MNNNINLKATITTNFREPTFATRNVTDSIAPVPKELIHQINAYVKKVQNEIESVLWSLVELDGSLDIHVNVQLLHVDPISDFEGDIKVMAGDNAFQREIQRLSQDIADQMTPHICNMIICSSQFRNQKISIPRTEKKPCPVPQE